MAGEKKGTWKKKKKKITVILMPDLSHLLLCLPAPFGCAPPAVALAGAPQALAVTGTQIKIQFLP